MFFFWELVIWILHIGRARHRGSVSGRGSHGRLSGEFVDVGGWLTHGDMALDSCAQFLAVAENRLIPAWAKSTGHQLWRADRQSVLTPACQDQIDVIRLCGAPLSAPSLVTAEFREFFRLGGAMRVVLHTGDGGAVHLFVVYGYHGSEQDSEKLSLTDKLLCAVLAEAQVVCVEQPFLIVGDFNADPGVIPCVAKGISSGRFVDLALAHSVGAGKEPDAICRFKLDECAGSRRDCVVACPIALAASTACWVTDRWFSSFVFGSGLRRYLVLGSLSLFGLLAGLILLIGLLPLPQGLFRIFGTSTEGLGTVLPDLDLAFRSASGGDGVDEF